MSGKCLFLNPRGRRCGRAAEPGAVFCRLHAPSGPEEEPAESLPQEPELSGYEPPALPIWLVVVRRLAAAVLLALFGLQSYLMIREFWK